MTSEQQQALQGHIRAIAKILYENAPKQQLSTLAGIERSVREQMLETVMPQVGVFLSKTSQAQQGDAGGP